MLIAPAAVLVHVGTINLKKYIFLMFCKKKDLIRLIMSIIVASGCSTHYYSRELNSNNLLVSTLIVHCFRYFVV